MSPSHLLIPHVQFGEPLRYPDHGLAMDVRSLELEASKSEGLSPRDAKELTRQLKGRLLQLRQANRNKERMAASFRNATLSGGKVGGWESMRDWSLDE